MGWILGMMLQGVYIFSPTLFNYQTDALKCVAQASKNRSLADFEKVRTQWTHMRPNINTISNVLFRNIYPLWPDIHIIVVPTVFIVSCQQIDTYPFLGKLQK